MIAMGRYGVIARMENKAGRDVFVVLEHVRAMTAGPTETTLPKGPRREAIRGFLSLVEIQASEISEQLGYEE